MPNQFFKEAINKIRDGNVLLCLTQDYDGTIEKLKQNYIGDYFIDPENSENKPLYYVGIFYKNTNTNQKSITHFGTIEKIVKVTEEASHSHNSNWEGRDRGRREIQLIKWTKLTHPLPSNWIRGGLTRYVKLSKILDRIIEEFGNDDVLPILNVISDSIKNSVVGQ